MSYSSDPTTNSETTIQNFHKILDQSEQVLQFFLCFRQKQSDWLNDSGFIFSVLVVGSGEQDI